MSFPLSYGGRLTEVGGKPLAGTVDLSFSFYAAATGGTALVSPLFVEDVTLVDGAFQVTLNLDDSDLHLIFNDSSQATWVEIKDLTHDRTFPRQRFNVVPYALKVPIDNTLTYDGFGRLHVGPLTAPGPDEFLTADNDGKLIWAKPAGSGGGGGAEVDDAITDGETTRAPSQNAVFDALAARDATINGKEPALAAGSTAQYLRGDKTWQTLNTGVVPENGNEYFTAARARAATVAQSITDGVTTSSPSQDVVFDALAGKEPAITAGTTAQYLAGDKSWHTLDTSVVPENGNEYFTTARARTAAVADAINDGVTNVAPSQNAVYDALAAKQSLSQKNAANGYAGLDGSGKILPANLPYNGLTYKGTWNAGTNTPALAAPNACGTSGDYYIVGVAGATDLDGISTWSLGDWVLCSSTGVWQRVGNSSSGITSINGLSGSTINMTTDDVSEGSSNQYFTAERAKAAAVQDALGNGVTDVAPSQNAVYDALALKEGSVSAGTSAQYYRGDKTWQTLDTSVVPENGNQYFTVARAKSAAVADAINDATTDVAPSQNAVFDAFAARDSAINGKEPAITAGTTGQYFRGDKTWQSFDSAARTAAVADSLSDGVTTIAPSQNAVFDALALKANATHTHSSLAASDGTPSQALVVDADGKVGIGSATPAAKLDVAGTVKIVDGTQGASKVLTSDANGVASWQTPSNDPVGTIKWFATASPPAGWLSLDGSSVSRTTYSSLFSAIGTTYGAGDGSTTFNVPYKRSMLAKPYRYYRLRMSSLEDAGTFVAIYDLKFKWGGQWRKNAKTGAASAAGTIGGLAATISEANVYPGYNTWWAFDAGGFALYYASGSGSFSATSPFDESSANWIKVDFGAGNSPAVEAFAIRCVDGYCPDTFWLEGSNDDSSWTQIPGSYQEGFVQGEFELGGAGVWAVKY